MTSYEEAVAAILRHIEALPAEEKPLQKCVGQVTVEDIYSEIDLPRTTIAGPDGYAVRSADIAAASRDNPVTLSIGETVRAGRPPRRKVKAGTAARVMTGSVFPEGADCVVRFEDTDEPPNKSGPNRAYPSRVRIYAAEKAGANLRLAGTSVAVGVKVLPKGTVIGPAQLSALTAIGKRTLKVTRRPVIAVIATGDELVPLGKPLGPGQTYDCNTATLGALIAHYGGIPKILSIARDRQESLRHRLRYGMTADAIVTSGGVSQGDFDLVRLVLSHMGEVVFSRIGMGPGAAFSFGLARVPEEARVLPVFALSGPPAGCMINFEAMVRPALLKMLGHTALQHPEVKAVALDSVTLKRPFSFVLWTRLKPVGSEYQVTLNGGNPPGSLTSIATANSLTILPENPKVRVGDRIKVWPLSWSR